MRQGTLFTTILLWSALAVPAVVPANAQDRSGLTLPLDPVAAEAVRREDLPAPMVAGCPADPVSFYPCAKEKIKTFNPPRTLDGKPSFQGFWNANRQAFNIEAHPVSYAYRGGPTLVIDSAGDRRPRGCICWYNRYSDAQHERNPEEFTHDLFGWTANLTFPLHARLLGAHSAKILNSALHVVRRAFSCLQVSWRQKRRDSFAPPAHLSLPFVVHPYSPTPYATRTDLPYITTLGACISV